MASTVKNDEVKDNSAKSSIKNDLSAIDLQQQADNAKPQLSSVDSIYNDIRSKLSQAQLQALQTNPVQSLWKKARKPRFEIELYDEVTSDETGEITGYKKVQSEHPIIIEAANKADLDEHAQRYQFCHQHMKIVRKIDDGDQCQQDLPQISQQDVCNRASQTSQASDPESNCNLAVQKQKPKFYKIGSIEIKDDNGKIYQKQWMKLSESEMSNFRVISDKNNSIVNLNGKHLEMKKWVLVERSDDESASLEDSLNDSK